MFKIKKTPQASAAFIQRAGKSAVSVLRQVLKGLLIFQLAVYPAYAGQPSARQTALEKKAQSFNQKHVESLRAYIFGTKNPQDYYTNHPLDSFSLLGQSHKGSDLEKQISDRKEQISELEEQIRVGQSHRTNFFGLPALPLLQKQTSEQKEQTSDLKKQISEQKEQIFELEKQVSELEKQIRYIRGIRLENLFVEIIDSGQAESLEAKPPADEKESLEAESRQREASLQSIRSILAHPSRQNRSAMVLDYSGLQEKLSASSVFINSSGEKASFRLSFHNEIVQSFPQNIEWLVFFSDYLVFLEKPKAAGEKALISFIDLRYFEKAIGKTGLPIFQIPVHYKSAGLTAQSLLEPEILTVEPVQTKEGGAESSLRINELQISESQIRYLSSLQQLSFNTTVTLLKPENAEITQAYLREIIDNYSAGLSHSELDSSGGKMSLDTKQMILKLLENRRLIGSAENLSGNYGQLNKINSQLNTGSKAAQDFKDSLIKDQAFQKEVSQTYSQISKKRGFWNRKFAFLNYLATPQPLGSPEITKSLGLIANSLSLKKDTVQNRFEAFKEALQKQFFNPKKNYLILSASVLIGAGVIAPETTAGVALFAVSKGANLLAGFWELISVTASSSFAWVNPGNFWNAYIKGDSYLHFLTGLTAVFIGVLGAVGSIHSSINAGYAIKNMKTEAVEEHQSLVRKKINQFISYMNRSRADFREALGNAQKKKMGIEAGLAFGNPPGTTHLLFKTANNLSSLYQAMADLEKPLSLELNLKKGESAIALEFIKKTHASQSALDIENQITLQINGSSAVFINTDTDIKLKNYFDPESNKLLKDFSLSLEISGENLHAEGILQNAEFSVEENQKVEELLKEVKEENQRRGSALKESEPLSSREITTLSQAMGEFFLGYSSWDKSIRFLGLKWNGFFVARHIVTRPFTLLPKTLYYSKYLKVSREGLPPSVFNGGRQGRLSRSVSQVQLGFKNMREFESQVKKIEKAFFEEVKAQTFLATVSEAGADNQAQLAGLGPHLKARDIESKSLKIFYGLHERELFEQSMRAYLSQKRGGNALFDEEMPSVRSNNQLKREKLKEFIEDPNVLKPPDRAEIRNLVELVAKKKKIAEKARSVADSLIPNFFKRLNLALENIAQDNLNPAVSLQMERAGASEKLLNDPEASARATRQQVTYLKIDKPIELFYKFLFLAGVEEGVLKPLHNEAFTEEAWFHLGRYAIWSGFFGNLLTELFAGGWLKTQMDSRLEETQGFDALPSRKEAEKSYFSWLKTQFFSKKDNSWWENQKFAVKLAYANFWPATVLMAMMWVPTLGRFDLELWLAGYMIYFTTPFMGLGFKLENAFEKSAGYAYKDLIKKGLDLADKDKKFLSHPKIQEYYIKESSKLRRKYNFWLALIYNNPIGNILDIFQNSTTSEGSRGLVRLFTPRGGIPTQYVSDFMSFLESKQILSSNWAERCKSIFTNNRPDIK